MCRNTAAPLFAMAGMAGTALGVAVAVFRERIDRRAIEREAEEEAKDRSKNSEKDSGPGDEAKG